MLGVWVTPSLNCRHQQRKLVEVARERSEAILESDASPKQNPSKLVMILTSLKLYVMYVLEQQAASSTGVQSLLVDYVQLGTAYLVRALNDEGRLGAVTKAILKAQAHAASGTDQVCRGHLQDP